MSEEDVQCENRPADRINELLNARQGSARRLVSIPVWGWTGHGKTTTLLTATQCATAHSDGLAFRLVKNTAELDELEQETEAYQGLGLSTIARVTEERMRELYSVFIDGMDWPPGTETGTPYLFQALSVRGTEGYVIFPDLQGGSYQSADQTAQKALDGAHACIVIVDSLQYTAGDSQAKEYQNDLLELLQMCSKRGLPVLVLLTKCDQYGGDHGPLDQTRTTLSPILDALFDSALVRNVSVIDEGASTPASTERPDLPPPDKRKVGNLVEAWIELTAQALCRDIGEILATIPPTNLQAVARAGGVPKRRLAELRSLREYSDAPGTVVGSVSDGRESTFLFLNEVGGTLFEAKVDLESGKYRFDADKRVADWDSEIQWPVAQIRSETVFIGPRQAAEHLWTGARGQDLAKTALSSTMAAWCAVSSDMIVGLDDAGRLHTLRLGGGKWSGVDFLAEFSAATPQLVMWFVPDIQGVVVLNGSTTEAVVVDQSGRFGDRLQVATKLAFPDGFAVMNDIAFAAAVDSSNQVHLVGAAEPIAGAMPETTSLAVAASAKLAAWHAADGSLRAAKVGKENVTLTAPSLSPKIEGTPTGLVWSPRGDGLVVTFNDERWGVYRTFGLSS